MTLFLVLGAASVGAQQGSLAAGGRVLLATVIDRLGSPVVDLEPDDFVVNDDGDDRDVVDVHIADYPVAILIDDGVPESAFETITSAVSRFIERIGERPIAVGLLSTPSSMVASLEDERTEVLARVRSLVANQASAPMTLPAVAHAASLLHETGSPFSAVLIVTGKPIDATEPVQGELLPSIVDSGAVVHVVSGRLPDQDGGLSPDVPDLLRVLSDQTRGQYAAIFSGPSYAVALDRLADRLATEMMIAYVMPPNSVGGEVRVGVRRPGARVLGLGVK